MVTFFMICVFSFNIYWIASGYYKGNIIINIIQALCFVFFHFQVKYLYGKLKTNEPVLVINDTHLIISEREESLLWEEIYAYQLQEDDSGTHLVLETIHGFRRVSLPWLDKSPKQITTYLRHYLMKQTT